MKQLILCAMVFMLAGCGTFKGQFENRVTCTVDKSQALVVSKYGPLGIASEVAEADAKIICK